MEVNRLKRNPRLWCQLPALPCRGVAVRQKHRILPLSPNLFHLPTRLVSEHVGAGSMLFAVWRVLSQAQDGSKVRTNGGSTLASPVFVLVAGRTIQRASRFSSRRICRHCRDSNSPIRQPVVSAAIRTALRCGSAWFNTRVSSSMPSAASRLVLAYRCPARSSPRSPVRA